MIILCNVFDFSKGINRLSTPIMKKKYKINSVKNFQKQFQFEKLEIFNFQRFFFYFKPPYQSKFISIKKSAAKQHVQESKNYHKKISYVLVYYDVNKYNKSFVKNNMVECLSAM